MPTPIHEGVACPECGSNATHFTRSGDKLLCDVCRHVFEPVDDIPVEEPESNGEPEMRTLMGEAPEPEPRHLPQRTVREVILVAAADTNQFRHIDRGRMSEHLLSEGYDRADEEAWVAGAVAVLVTDGALVEDPYSSGITYYRPTA